METTGRKKMRLGDILLMEQIITEYQLSNALEIQKKAGKKLGEVIIELGYTTEKNILKALSRQLGIDIVSLKGMEVPEELLNLVNVSVLRKHVMIPYSYDPNNINVVRVAMADPMDMLGLDDFSIISNMQVEPVIATTSEILLALDHYYGDAEALVAAQQYAKERQGMEAESSAEEDNADVNNSPIVLLVKSMIEQAARQRASDIHVEPLENNIRVRYRIDGVLYEKMSYNKQLLAAITARLKIIGGMDISEKRKPQDGRITMVVDRIEYDIRVSFLPTVYGEKCVMRLAQKKALKRDKKELGFSERELQEFEHILKNPHGILLVTGPTGSGKSTTLYTALSELNREDINIITVEDPVEANIEGINQVQVNPKADLTFETALRSILRQDPDVIMIGEIRDVETAAIAVQASITGHFVVSTLHTNSAANAITRLQDMGIQKYLLADSMVGVIAQRLVRRLCPHCKKAKKATIEEKRLLFVPEDKECIIYEAAGCPQCNEIGYYGRTGVYEIMSVTNNLKSMIGKGATADEIKEEAVREGMNTLYMSAAELVLQGTTTINEMMHVAFEN